MPEVAEMQHAVTDRLAQRFWSKVERRDANECWKWLGGVGRSGYGLFWDGTKVRTASRIAYLLSKGDPAKFQVHHTCDNPVCCNPSHLWLGTQRQNMIDMAKKGRTRKNRVTLSMERDVREMWRQGQTIASISRGFGLSIKTVQSIVR